VIAFYPKFPASRVINICKMYISAAMSKA